MAELCHIVPFEADVQGIAQQSPQYFWKSIILNDSQNYCYGPNSNWPSRHAVIPHPTSITHHLLVLNSTD